MDQQYGAPWPAPIILFGVIAEELLEKAPDPGMDHSRQVPGSNDHQDAIDLAAWDWPIAQTEGIRNEICFTAG